MLLGWLGWLGYKLGLGWVLGLLIGWDGLSGWLDRVGLAPLNNPPFPPFVPQRGKGFLWSECE